MPGAAVLAAIESVGPIIARQAEIASFLASTSAQMVPDVMKDLSLLKKGFSRCSE